MRRVPRRVTPRQILGPKGDGKIRTKDPTNADVRARARRRGGILTRCEDALKASCRDSFAGRPNQPLAVNANVNVKANLHAHAHAPAMPLLDQLTATLKERQRKGMLRTLTTHRPATLSPSSTLADFSSNDYLSIATSTGLKRRFLQRVQADDARVGGSTGSRLLDGNNGVGEMEALERRLCKYFHARDGLLCPSGWEANVSLFSTLPQRGDVVLYDSLVHASVHDGLRRCRARCVAFQHNDVGDFEMQLEREVASIPPDANVFMAVESLYSMDGDFAPLHALVAAARRHLPRGSGRFWTVIDEAHSGGCFGPNGAGMGVQLSDDDDSVLRVMTFGKGFGASGAIILCPSVVRHYLVNYARPLIFSTAMAHSALILVHAALDVLVEEGQQRRERMYENCALLKARLAAVLPPGSRDENGLLAIRDDAVAVGGGGGGRDYSMTTTRAVCNTVVVEDAADPMASSSNAFSVSSSSSPIMPLLTPHHYTRPLALYLQSRGYLVRPITYPTVPLGKDRIRICVHSDNTRAEIEGFAKAVGDWIREKRAASASASATASGDSAATFSAKSRL